MKKTKLLTLAILLTILLSSCAAARGDSMAAPLPAPSPSPTPVQTPESAPDDTPAQAEPAPEFTIPAPALQQRTYLLSGNGATYCAMPAFGFYGNCSKKDDTLFQAIYKSLTGTSWTTVAEGAGNFQACLPDGVEVDDFYISEEIGLEGVGEPGYKEPKITKHVRKDLDLAYICNENRYWNPVEWSSISDILLLFDIRDGYCVPYGGVIIGCSWYNMENNYSVIGAGDMRWVVEDGLWLHGTGKWREGRKWWNIDERAVDIAYAYEERDELERPPLGITSFRGTLEGPKLSKSEDGALLRLEIQVHRRSP